MRIVVSKYKNLKENVRAFTFVSLHAGFIIVATPILNSTNDNCPFSLQNEHDTLEIFGSTITNVIC